MLLFLQNAAAPTALFVLGVTVALRPFDRVPWEVPGVIAVKLLIHPLIVFGLMLLFGPFAQPWAATAVLMASLPPALNVFVIARQNDTWIEPASVAVLIGTFASVVTLTSVMWSHPDRAVWRFRRALIVAAACSPRGRQPLAHRKPPQRADRADQMHAGARAATARQEVAEQRAVRDIDRRRCGWRHRCAARRSIARQHLRRAGILARATSLAGRYRRCRRHRAIPC